MRTSLFVLAALLVAAPAVAPAQSVLQPSDREGYYVTPYEMIWVYGVYQLSDFRQLRITYKGRHVWADLSGVGRMSLTPVSSIAFVSPDRRMRLEFKPIVFAEESTALVRDIAGMTLPFLTEKTLDSLSLSGDPPQTVDFAKTKLHTPPRDEGLLNFDS